MPIDDITIGGAFSGAPISGAPIAETSITDASFAEKPLSEEYCDIAIIGGGIAGLWLLNRLVNAGYNAILLEQDALGSHQTVASQGMIHGGIKYTLKGGLTGASEAIAHMPDLWRRCLAGQGEVDLRKAAILSDHFYLWSSGGTLSNMATFLASKATRGRVNKVSRRNRPAIFQHADFKGSLYQLVDMVLDVPSVVAALRDNCAERIFNIDWNQCRWCNAFHSQNETKNQSSSTGHHVLEFLQPDRVTRLIPRQIVLTAGQGNEALLQSLHIQQPEMQRRPLHQVMVKHRHPHAFYGHCLGSEATPRLSISSHPCKDGQQVWYLGGTLAEKGVDMPPDTLIAAAKQELSSLLPWVDLTDAQWATLPVNRAEPKQRGLMRPDNASVTAIENTNVMVGWPTKLTLSPNLADEVMAQLNHRAIQPSQLPLPNLRFLGQPPLANTPWDEAFAP